MGEGDDGRFSRRPSLPAGNMVLILEPRFLGFIPRFHRERFSGKLGCYENEQGERLRSGLEGVTPGPRCLCRVSF